MVEFYKYFSKDFNNEDNFLTIATGPVILNKKKEFLLHIAPSTNKYQFIGGRLDDNKSSRENCIFRAYEELGLEIEIIKEKPFVITDKITQNNKNINLILIHYLSKIKAKSNLEQINYKWFSYKEIIELDKKNMLSSPNIKIACKYFLN